MESTAQTTTPTPTPGPAFSRFPTWLTAGAVVLVAVLALGQGSMKAGPLAADTTTDRLAQCEQDGGIVVESLAGHGIDLRSPKWRRDRARAIEACRNGFPDLRWLGP